MVLEAGAGAQAVTVVLIGLFCFALIASSPVEASSASTTLATTSNSSCVAVDLFSTCSCHMLYGGEEMEVIRFMENEQWDSERWLQELAEEVAAVEALPFVKPGSVAFVCAPEGSPANDDKVKATVWCCWDASRQSFKQVVVSCDDSLKRTHLEALKALRLKLSEEHGCEGHKQHPRAVERRQQMQGGERRDLQSAFDVMALAAAHQRRLSAAAIHDEKVADSARAAEMKATREREDAEKKARASRATYDAAKGPTNSKRQKVGADSSKGASNAEGTSNEREVDGEAATWESWSLSTWRRLEANTQSRRSVEIKDDHETEASALPPRGDDTRGWRGHWRRGLIGGVQDWAEGSRSNAAYMLAALAVHFNVEKQAHKTWEGGWGLG